MAENVTPTEPGPELANPAGAVESSARPIVILGAGYGGLAAARILGKTLRGRPGYRVVLVDRNPHHELKPKLPEAAGEWIDCAVQVPIAAALEGREVEFLQAAVTGIDLNASQVHTEAGPLGYWRLVVALGGQPDFTPGDRYIPGLSAGAIAPYGMGAACRLRHHVADMVAQAAGLPTPEARAPFLTMVVAGGGFVGVEMAGELADRLPELTARHGLPAGEARVILLEPRGQLLGFDPILGSAALKTLRAKGVDVRLGIGLAEVQPERLRLDDGAWLESRTLVWAGGVRGHPLAAAAGLPTDRRDRVEVGPALRVLGRSDVYALGDSAHCVALDQRPALAGSGQAAAEQGRAIARAILAEVDGQPLEPYRPRSAGTVVLLGRRDAIARVGPWAPLRPLAPWLKQVAMLEHLWRIGGVGLIRRHLGSTMLPLLAPGRVVRYDLAGDAPSSPPPVRA